MHRLFCLSDLPLLVSCFFEFVKIRVTARTTATAANGDDFRKIYGPILPENVRFQIEQYFSRGGIDQKPHQ
jgi:hypothetical protein